MGAVMRDVFVSYARPDEPFAETVADALRAEGYTVWRDDQLPAHRSYAEVIEERLGAAGAVVVLWSAEAGRSQWVRAEADFARGAGTLVQVTIDGGIPPMPFNQIQCAALGGWTGDRQAPGWKKLLASVAALAGAVEQAPQRRASSAQFSVCVLPFANMSGDPEQEYFSDGISEDITTDLSKISALGVTARNTAFTFKGQACDVGEVARKLGVSHVLEGSVRKVGDRLRITAQLIDGASGEHVWAERYDRDLTDIFAIQDEISQSIVAALKLKLLPAEKKVIAQRGTTNVEAYNLYLLARQYWVTGNHGDIRREQRVMRISSRAVEIDPYYAQAWALLALAQSNLRYAYGAEVEDGVAAAHSALSIDPQIAEAYCAMVRRLEERGEYDEAEAELRKALRIDAESWEVNKVAGQACMRDGRVADAARHFEQAIAAIDSDVDACAMLVRCYRILGDKAAEKTAAEMTLAQAEQVLAKDPSNGAAMAFGARALAALGKHENAREWMARAMLIDFDNLKMRYDFACMLAVEFDDKDGALRLLQRYFTSITRHQLKIAEADPELASLRDDARFVNMVARARARLGVKAEQGLAGLTAATPTPVTGRPMP